MDHLRKAFAARLYSEANDLKRTPSALAQEIGMPQDVVIQALRGERDVDTLGEIARRMADAYPIALADLLVSDDDSDSGVVLCSAAQSKTSARIFDRANAQGGLSAYYEYRDTAMSRLGPFKPEWIQPLRVLEDNDPDNPDVAFNKGHLLHQQTFFIGEVNFYWSQGGKRHCAVLNTGDSNYVTPFVPHSFTSRSSERLGLIIAITFAGEVGRARGLLAHLNAQDVLSASGNSRDSKGQYAAALSRRMAADAMEARHLADALVERGIGARRAQALGAGELPDAEELVRIAACLDVEPEELRPRAAVAPEEEIVVQRITSSRPRDFLVGNDLAMRLRPLARSRRQSWMRGFEAEILGEGPEFRHSLFEYVYNFGEAPVRLCWAAGREAILQAGDSACILPFIGHRFEAVGGEPARIAIARVPGAVTEGVLSELSDFDVAGRSRALQETTQWF